MVLFRDTTWSVSRAGPHKTLVDALLTGRVSPPILAFGRFRIGLDTAYKWPWIIAVDKHLFAAGIRAKFWVWLTIFCVVEKSEATVQVQQCVQFHPQMILPRIALDPKPLGLRVVQEISSA